ncbi:MAG: hypothetical protein OQK46_01200 [Gammaproteobacteria bacterium]|nr:hypothetical protein [Gammaproteobacteria bacterium]
MLIAIATTSAEGNAKIDQHGARAAYYQFINTQTGKTETLANPVSEQQGGAGPKVATFLINKGVNKVVAGDFGNRFRVELEQAGVVCMQMTGELAVFLAELKK